MKNNFKTIIVCVLCVAMFLMATGCGKQETVENPQETTQNNQNILQDIIDDVIEESEKQDVGTYVTPAESFFVWETVEGGVMITDYTGTDKSIIVPDTLGGENVVAIGSGAFNQAEIVGIKLPGTLTAVGEKAFAFCTTLQEVYLGVATESIGTDAFDGCYALRTVDFGDALNTVGQRAFANCQSLTEVHLPDSVTLIESGAFLLSGIEELVIPGSVKEIGPQAFSCCNNMTKVEIKEGVEIIGKKAFETCPVLNSAIIPASVVEIGSRAFNQCENVKIITPAGSAAETYAEDNELTFEAS